MAKLEWDKVGERFFETGVDRGVLYLSSGSYPWNGLMSVDENPTETVPKPQYIDGVRYRNETPIHEFGGVVGAFTYPNAFDFCLGYRTTGNGLHIDNQPYLEFGLSYRTLLGNDLKGPTRGYKIHLVYNAMISSRPANHRTLTNTIMPEQFAWPFMTRPVTVDKFKHSAHLVIDSTETNPLLLATLEDRIYGKSGKSAYLPAPNELIDLFENYEPTGYGYGPYGGGLYGHGDEY